MHRDARLSFPIYLSHIIFFNDLGIFFFLLVVLDCFMSFPMLCLIISLTYTFERAAGYGSLENMKWLLEHGCPWGENTFLEAAFHGSLENMKWLRTNGCPWNTGTFERAAGHGSLENIKWLKTNRCPWNEYTFERAVIHGSLENMKWLRTNGCPCY
ncbi:unnamed protein product [Pylaiella littoralis]